MYKYIAECWRLCYDEAMLKLFRKHRNVQLLIFGGLAALFVLWGVGGTLGTRHTAYAGMLFGRKVPLRVFQEQERLVARTLRLAQPDQPLAPELVESQTWLRLILLDDARRKQLRVSDEAVVAAIQQRPLFQREGRFDAERYGQFLRFQRLLPRQFEEEVRQEILLDTLREHVVRDATTAEAQPAQWDAYVTDAITRAGVRSYLRSD